MTIKQFIKSSDFYTYELDFEIFDIKSGGKIKYNLTKQELCHYYNEKIKQIDFTTSGDNSGESYLTIRFYI